MKDANIIPLQQFYMMAIAAVAEAEKLDCVLQDFGTEKTGRLFLVRDGSTVPEAVVAFDFGKDVVKLGIQTRNEQELVRDVKYAEGLDAFLPEMVKTLQAGRLADLSKRKRAA